MSASDQIGDGAEKAESTKDDIPPMQEFTPKPYRTGFLKAFFGELTFPPTEAMRWAARRENVLTLAGDFYHYTSIEGLQGIVQTGGFWASDNRFMNDAEEMTDGLRLAIDVLKRRSARPSLFSKVLSATLDRLENQPRQGRLVACFSRVRDNLGQWRGYAKSGGVCLKIEQAKTGERHIFFGPQQLPYEAFYRFRPKAKLLLSIIRRFELEYELDRQVMQDRWPGDHDENYVDQLHSLISSRIVAFKNESFANEAETRLVIPYSYEDQYEGGLKFRATAHGLVPYLCTGDLIGAQGLLPLAEVMIGPHPRQELIAEGVEIFLKHHGYDVPILLSSVPFRA